MATSRKAPLAPPAAIDVDVDVDVEVEVEVEPERKPRRRARPVARRRGRPADSDGLTGQRILAAARECFAESGYAVASTHMVASRVGLTTGALYHHFGSKRELYLAVLDEVEQLMYDRFRAVTEPQPTFVAKLEAILDETVRIHTTDPTLAGFALSVTGDLARHPDLREALQSAWVRRDNFFANVVEDGIVSGEVAAADRGVALATLTTIATGLLVVSNGMPVAPADAVTGFKRLVAGTLFMS